MIANLQAHYGFTRMPFTSAIPVAALYRPPPPARKPSPACAGSSPPAASAS